MLNYPKNLALAAVLFVTSAMPGLLLAQQSGGNLVETWIMTVKKGQQAPFETAFKNHGAVRAANGDARSWQVYTPVTGNELNVYELRTCCHTWADQDAYTAWDESNPNVMSDWFSNVDQYVENYGHYFEEVDANNSSWSESDPAPAYVGVTVYHIDPAHGADFSAARKEVSQIALNQGWSAAGNRWLWTTQIGGKPVTALAVPFSNFADMAPEGQSFIEFIRQNLGEAAASDLFTRFTSGVRGSSYTIYRYRPDLSTPGQ